MKVKNLFKSKRKGAALPASPDTTAASGSGCEVSSVQSASDPAKATDPKETLIENVQEVSISSDSNEIEPGSDEGSTPGKALVVEDAIPSLSITENDAVLNPRVKSAKEQLIEASGALTDTLKLYREGHKDAEMNIPFLDDDAKIAEPGEQMTAEKVAATVDAIVAQQQSRKPTAAARVGSVIGKIFPLVSLTMGVGATVAESASFVPVKGAVNGLCLLLSIANQEQGRSADFLRQLDRISYQALRVAEIQKHGEIDIGDLILESSMKLMTAILLFFKGAVMFFRHDYFFNLGKTILLGPQIYADAKSTLDAAINDYDQALLLQVTIKVLLMQSLPAPTEDHGQSKKSELLSWLKSSHWEVDAEYSHHCEDRAPGTLKWVLEAEEFRDWRLSDRKISENRSLWLNGLPGVGKSTIAAYITQVLQTQYPDAAVLYFFCRSGDSSLDNVLQIIRTLAAQLLLAVPAARTHLQGLKDNSFSGSNSVTHMLQKLVRDSLAGILQDVFVIIDGFDECENNTDGRGGENALERLLEGLLNTDVKLLVSSRPTPEISRAMAPAKKRDFTYEDSREDIQSYVTSCVSKSKILEKGFKTVGKDPAEFIAEKSQGNFLWVKIVLNILKNKSSTKDFQEVIETIPKDLEDIYDQLLTKLDASGSLELALTLIRCVLFPVRPLTIGEAEVAVNILLGDIIDLRDFVESYCGSFLRVIPGKASGLYIVHETFRSYITTATSSKEKCILPGSSHVQLATACVGCLGEPENIELDPFRSYSAEYWLDHIADILHDSSQAPGADVLRLVHKTHGFLSSSEALRKWMEQYSFLCNEKYLIGYRIANMHDVVMDFVAAHANVPPEHGLLDAKKTQDIPPTLAFMSLFTAGNNLRDRVCDEFLYVWINTNWQEAETAKYMIEGAYTARSILTPPPGTLQSGGKRRERLMERNEEQTAHKRGWKFQYSRGGDYHHTITIEELKDLATAAKYNDSIGVQRGNYAFGEAMVKSDHCVQSFQNAIDEDPECWHLHEGLGKYYERNDKREDAIICYAEAMKVDPKNPASAAFDHWKLVSAIKEENSDTDGAIEAFKAGVANVPDKDSHRYWDAMVNIRKKSGDGNAMADLYKEAIKKHPGACNYFTKELAKVYGLGGARQLQFQTYYEAMKNDPENIDEYGDNIRTLASEMKDVCIWQPVDYILGVGIESDPKNAGKYHKELGLAHMCRRNWNEAIEHLGTYARLSEDDWAYLDIGNAYLGLGNVAAAITAYHQAIKSKTNYTALSRHVGFAHIVDGNYTQAIKLFKSTLSYLVANPDAGMSHGFMQKVDDVKPFQMFELHRALGLCYEATGRTEDMKKSLQTAVDCYKNTALEMDEEKDRDTLYRHEARALFELGLVQEKLGQIEEALTLISRAVVLFEKTTLNTDDEVQSSEASEAAAAWERLSSPEDQEGKPLPDLKEKFGEMRLQRRLALKYTTDWYCFKHWEPPRQRGGMDWNRVSFTNKFKICNGDRTFIAPWGFGHGE